MKTVAIIQARMGSTRLPGKVLLKVCGNTVLSHVIERVRLSKEVDDIVIATTIHSADNAIEVEAQKNGIHVYRGSEEDVLERYYFTAKENAADIVVRITSDCPLIDPYVIDSLVKCFKSNDYDLVTNAGADLTKRTYPRGLDTEVFSYSILEVAYNSAKQNYQREHVTPYIYEKGSRIFYYLNHTDYSKYRWTLDTEDDMRLITKIYEKLYEGKHDFFLDDIIKLFDEYPEYAQINAHVEQKKLGQ